MGDAFLNDEVLGEFLLDFLVAVNGASIRLDSPSGLRFASKVNVEKLAYLEKIFGKATVGTLIAPADYVEAAGEFTKEALDALNKTVAYVDVAFEGAYFKGDGGFDVGNDSYVVGSIVNIREQNIAREFAGATYVSFTVGDVSYTIYAATQVRSVRYVADCALADTSRNWTSEQLAVLNSFATPAN